MLNICSVWKLKQDTLRGGEFDVILEEAKCPVLSLKILKVWLVFWLLFGCCFLFCFILWRFCVCVFGDFLLFFFFLMWKKNYCNFHILLNVFLPVSPGNLEIKEQRFCSSAEWKTIILCVFHLVLVTKLSASKHQYIYIILDLPIGSLAWFLMIKQFIQGSFV